MSAYANDNAVDQDRIKELAAKMDDYKTDFLKDLEEFWQYLVLMGYQLRQHLMENQQPKL